MTRSPYNAALDAITDHQRAFRSVVNFIRIVSISPRLGAILRDVDHSADGEERKKALIATLMKGAYDEAPAKLILAAIQAHDGQPPVEALATSAIDLALLAGDVDAIASSLHAIAELVEQHRDLYMALTNPGTSNDAKAGFLRELLDGKADSYAIDLSRAFIYINNGRGVDGRCLAAEAVAVARRGKTVAEVRTAVQLDEAHRNRLVASLESAMGSAIEARFTVDERILGSVIVRIGNDVFDGSVRRRLNQARTAMAAVS